MRLSDLDRSRTGDVRYVATLSDSTGNAFYGLGISGADS